MSALGFTQGSVLSSGLQTFSLASLIAADAGPASPAVLALRAYDRDVYSGVQSYDYGKFSSPGGGNVSAGTQSHPTLLYFDLKDGVYVSRDTGESLSAYQFTSSGENHRSVYLSLFTSIVQGASYDSSWLDPAWTHLSDLNVVTRTDYVDATPNAATAQEIAAIAKGFIGQVWNSEGCWLLASNIAAAAGASLPVTSARLDTAGIGGNGPWQVVFNGARQQDDWRALLRVGDVVELGYLDGKAHIATVTSGSGHQAMWVDNSGVSADDGTPTDIIIQGEHAVDLWTGSAVDRSVVVFRLAATDTAPAALPAPVAAPVLTPHAQSIPVGQSLSVASLFSVQDPNLLAMSSYRIGDQHGAGRIELNGAVNLATDAQRDAGVVIVSAADLAKLSYVAALGPDTLTITAFNGQSWGTTQVGVTGWTDPPPVVTGASIAVHAHSQQIAVSTLFSASSANGQAISQYRFEDADHTGQLLVDARLNLAGNEEAAQGIYRVNASDLGAVAWRALADTGTLRVSAFDGVQWSDFVAVTVAGHNSAPTVTPAARANVSVGQAVPVASLFSVSDADHDPVKMVSIYDFYDHIELNGATDYCPFAHAYEVTLDELSKLTYRTDSVMGGLQGISVYAYDGTSWSAPASVTFTIDDPAPVLRPNPSAAIAPGQRVALDSLFSVVDPHGLAVTQYMVQDAGGGGSIALNGAQNLATPAQLAQGVIVVAAAELALLTYDAGPGNGSESLHISAFNGKTWGGSYLLLSTSDGAAPVINVPAATVDIGRTVALDGMLMAYTPSGRPVTTYRILDPDGGGSVLLNGARDLSAPDDRALGVLVSAEDLGKLRYVGASGEGSESLTVSAFDGGSWGSGQLLVTSRNYGRPVVTPIDLTLHAGQSVSLQDLFRTKGADVAAIAGYQINDAGHHLQLNGADNYYANEQYKGVYGFTAADLPKVAFVAGAPGTETIQVEAGSAGGASSMMETVTITVLSNPVITPSTVTVGIHQTVALTSLFSASNPSGKAQQQFAIDTGGSGGTLHLNGAVNLASADQQSHGTVVVDAADLGKLSYTGADSFHTDALAISAFDGESWGAGTVPVTTIDGTPPQVAGKGASVEVDATVSLDSLFSATSHSGLPITLYKIANPNGGGKLVLNGVHNAATPAQQAQDGLAIIAAGDLGKVQYVGADTPGSETLAISAFDGQSWGTASISVASEKSAPPVVTPHFSALEPGQPVRLTSLFDVSDPGGKAPSYYLFQDSSGNIALNGAANLWAAQQAAGYYWISAADIGKVSYAASADGVYHYSVIVNDGANFSNWTSGLAVVGQERLSLPPELTPALSTLALNQHVALAQLFALHDPLGNAISRYRVADPAGGGALALNGAVDLASVAEHAQGVSVFAAADLAKVQYVAASGSGVESLNIGAFDGVAWGAADIAITSAVLPPVIGATAAHIGINQVLALDALFSVAVSSGGAISAYQFQDPAGGGTVLLNGAANLATAAQQEQGISIVAAADLAHLRYAAGAAADTETLLFSAFDGETWGAANIALQTRDERAPVIVAGADSVDLAASVPLNTLFTAESISGRPVVQYLIADPSGGGRVQINSAHNLASAAQTSQGITVVAAYDLANMLYTGGSGAGSETLTITAFDGQQSSTADLHIASVAPVLPVVTVTPVTIHVGEAVRLSDLATIVDPNGHAIQWYFVLDPSLGIELNGAANLAVSPYYDYHGHYDFNNTADWNKIEYVGQTPGTFKLVVQAYDGYHVSNYVEEVITVVGQSGA